MSKADDTRAMREARHAAFRARVDQPTATPEAPRKLASRTPTVAGAETAPQAVPDSSGQSGLCGHRAMSGRTCTREQGHTAKSHRYS